MQNQDANASPPVAPRGAIAPTGEARVVSPGFRARVYARVREVPAGFVTTYGDVATVLGSPRVARHVGYALAALDDPGVPWHRVVNAAGRISHRGDLVRAEGQRHRLEAEGIVFDANGRLPLERHRFRFPEDAPGLSGEAAP